MKEIWKDIKGYEKLYQISNLGRVKSLKPRYKDKVILKPSADGGRYLGVFLYKNKNRKRFLIHRLVASMFIANPLNKSQVNHINGDKQNNIVTNLEWCTPRENIIHACKTGIGTVGERNGLSKFTNEQVEYLRKIHKPFDHKYGASALAKKYNVNINNMCRILNGKSYKKISKEENV